jgi:GAG-pre-integrase domain
MDRIQSALENSPRLLAAVDRARQWVKKYRTKQGEEQHHSDKAGRKHHQSFAIQSPRSGFSLEGGNDSYDNEEEYKLTDSFLLNSAASIHVCNNRSRFTTFTPSTGKETMRAANSFAVIQDYGTVEVHAKSATPGDLKPCTLELLEVAYVPSFSTSLVSFGRAWAKGIRWDTNRMTLDVGNKPLCKVTQMFDQWVLEYTPLSSNNNAAMVTRRRTTPTSAKPLVSKGSVDLWHRRLAHLGKDMVKKLPDHCDGVRLDPTPSDDTNEVKSPCETCKLTVAPRQISRRPLPCSSILFEKVHFDLISFTEAYNGDEWALHFLEDAARMNYVFSFPAKSDCLQYIKDFYEMVVTQYDRRIKKFKYDGERTLGNEYGRWRLDRGILNEQSVPYTPEQNGPAGRSGGGDYYES